MKNVLRSAAFAALLSTAAVTANAAENDEIAQIREQLQSLIQRVDRLEQENVALKAENEKLKEQDEYLKAEARGLRKESAVNSAEVAKYKGADWASKVALKGDLRYRHEETSDDTLTSAGVPNADRSRDRIRARIAAEVKATDTISLGFGLASSEGGDPRSSNQTLTGVFSRKSFDLELAYFDWDFASWGQLIGGKMKQPFFRPGQSLFWDSDVYPEGLAVNFSRGIYFGTAYGYWVNEVSGAENTVTADTMLFGGQLGAKLPLGESTLILAAHYYDLAAAKGRAPFYNNNALGNTTVAIPSGTSTVNVLANDFRVVNLSAEFNTKLGQLPLQLWADLARNQAVDDFDTAWTAGVMFGKASDRGTWEFGAAYEVLEKDALFAQFIDADFAGGNSDGEGLMLRAGYAPVRNWALNATYFLNDRNVDVANAAGQRKVEFERLLLDFNVKF